MASSVTSEASSLSTAEQIPSAIGEQPLPVVQVRGFTKSYKRRPAVQNVSLSVNRGEIFGLIGPDGSGKSSLMKAIAGVLTFDSGRLEVFGTPLDTEEQAERIKGRLGFMPQGLGLNLYADLSVEENVDYFARLRLVPENLIAERKSRLLAMTRLDRYRNRQMKNLSGGMKQKLGLVCTLIHEPELVILDEPTTGVDPVSRRDFWAILAELLAERGMTAIVSTAYLDEASRFHHLALMYSGRIISNGEPGEILSAIPGALVTVNAAEQSECAGRLKRHFAQVETVGNSVRVFVERPDSAGAAGLVRGALGDLEVDSIESGEPELEDVFIALLRKQGIGVQQTAPTTETPTVWSEHHDNDGSHPAIEANELTRNFGDFRAADRVTFQVRRGEIFGLLGANGAGKTTIIKMLTGILPPSTGKGHIAGKDVTRSGTDIKRRIGYVSQAFSLYQDLTVIENIRLYGSIYGLSSRDMRERAGWVLSLAGLEGHENDLSGSLPMGLRQRLALGCALLHRPRVLFLDEPTSGVDPVGRRAFWDILFDLSRNQGVTILVTTHYMSEAEHCDHLALMYSGRIVADASPREMKQQVTKEAGTLLQVECEQPARAVNLLEAAGLARTAVFGKHVHLLTHEAEADANRVHEILASHGLRAGSVRPIPLSMEDVFVYLVSQLEKRDEAAIKEMES